jgi:hypothetical protein
MKIFCMRSVLRLLQTSILKGSLATNDRQVILPTAEQLKKMRKSMQEAKEELQKRELAVADEVADVSVPIHRVWHSGSFDADRNNLTTAYAGRYGVPAMPDVAGEPAWDLFGRVSSRELFALIKVGYEGSFREFLPLVNVVDEAIQPLVLPANTRSEFCPGFFGSTSDRGRRRHAFHDSSWARTPRRSTPWLPGCARTGFRIFSPAKAAADTYGVYPCSTTL